MPKLSLARLVPHLGRHGRATRWRRTRGRPRVWAHRGDSAHAPENTLLAFDKARAAGADGIELDVRFDGDGNVVVFHDSLLDRLTGQPGRIEQLSAAERARLRVSGEPVPLLADVLAAADRELEIDVELKVDRPGRAGGLAEATARIIKASGRAEQVLVSSFDPIALVHDDQALPMRRGWIGTLIGASLAHPQHTLCTEARVQAWHRAGLPVNTWTVDDADELARLARIGVDGVFCNDPGHAISVLSAAVSS